MNNLPQPVVTQTYDNATYMVFESHVVSAEINKPHSIPDLKAKLQGYKYVSTQILDKSINPDMGDMQLYMVTFFDAEDAKKFAESL